MKNYKATYEHATTGEQKTETIKATTAVQALMAGLALRKTAFKGYTLTRIEPEEA